MTTIKCTHCGKDIELSEALTKDIESSIIEAEHKKHVAEVEQLKKEADENLVKQLEQEKLKAQTEAAAKVEFRLKQLQEESVADKKEKVELREQLTALMQELRDSKRTAANIEIEMQKKLTAEESKIREDAEKSADEKQRLKIAEKDKQLEAARKANEDLERKLNIGSQQMQGEVLELDLEQALAGAFHDDSIVPIAKGVNGADINQVVRSQSGIECGVILWELKRTKNWTDGWIPKLKTDLRSAKANIPVIVSEVLPKQLDNDMGQVNGVWICKPKLAIILATLLRKALLDVGRERVIALNRGDKAESLYGFVTSHEFIQQVESMVETYQEMTLQVQKERIAYEKLWAQREKQAQKLLMSTANIIGSMQGYIGQASMPKIKGLDLLGDGEN